YIAPPPTDDIASRRHSAAPLDKKTLAVLAKKFADGVPEEEFSVAGLQGCEYMRSNAFCSRSCSVGCGWLVYFLWSCSALCSTFMGAPSSSDTPTVDACRLWCGWEGVDVSSPCSLALEKMSSSDFGRRRIGFGSIPDRITSYLISP